MFSLYRLQETPQGFWSSIKWILNIDDVHLDILEYTQKYIHLNVNQKSVVGEFVDLLMPHFTKR